MTTMENQAIARAHKGQGIASFTIGILSVAAVIGLIAAAAVAQLKTGKVTPEFTLILGLSLMSVAFVDLIGIGLGVFGAADRASKKTFPALGLFLNFAMIALFVTCVVIGLSMKGH